MRTVSICGILAFSIIMGKKRVDKDKIVQAFLTSAAEKGAGGSSLADIAKLLGITKASLYNHFESRDQMYDAAVSFCAEYMSRVEFITGGTDAYLQLLPADAFAKIVRQYFRSYEIEPLFPMYVFIHSEQFFSKAAADTAAAEKEKIASGLTDLIVKFEADGKLSQHPLKDTQRSSSFLATALCEQLSSYIMNKKETVRQNPESGAGSLFSLPPDDALLTSILEQDLIYWKQIIA